jgi:DNA invertase Pin-like site-specific DNA recombinase
VPKPRRDLTGPPRVVLYTRVSTGEQADSGAGLAAQESQLRAETERRGWLVVGLLSDAGASGSSMRKRPALADALALVDHGQGDVLAVAKLDRLSRSVLDFAQLMVRARDLGWGLVALDLGVDTTTTSGRLVANVMVSVAEWERDIIGQRTREGLAERRAAGVRLGGPQMVPAPIVARIVRGRRAGCTVRGIAAGLTAEGVPTARGGTVWASSSVQAVLRSQAASAWAGLA